MVNMKITKTTTILMIVSLVGLGVLYSPNFVSAAPQSLPITLSPTLDDDPHINNSTDAPTLSMSGVELQTPLNATTTNNDDAATMENVYGYTWRVVMPDICEGAQITGIRIATNTSASTESSVSGILLAVYGTQDFTVYDQYTITEGEDGQNWLPPLYSMSTPVVTRGIGDDTYFPANLGVAGALDATWDITGYTPGDPLGVYIQHWLGGTTVAQTAIETAELLYDDAGCGSPTDDEDEPGDASPTSNGSVSTLANTGTPRGLLLAVISLTLLMGSVGFATSIRSKI